MSKENKHCTKVDFSSFTELLAKSQPREVPSSGRPHQRDVPTPLGSNSNSKKRESPHQIAHTRKKVSGGPKAFGLPQVCEGTSRRLIVREESPWDTYRRTLRCNLAGDVFIASRRSRPSQVVAIREYTEGDVVKMRRLYDILDHDNVLTARECFINEGRIYALVHDLPLTLEQLVGCRSLYPTETELASMVWQVRSSSHFNYPELMVVQILNGLCYLNDTGLEHQFLTCRSILLGLDGIVKIGRWPFPPSS